MRHIVGLSVLALALGGCVSAGKYKDVVEETKALQAKASALESENAALRADHAAKMKDAQGRLEGRKRGEARRLEQVEDKVIEIAVADANRVRLAKSLQIRRKGIGRQPARFEPRQEGAEVGPRDGAGSPALRHEFAARREYRARAEHREMDTHGGRIP